MCETELTSLQEQARESYAGYSADALLNELARLEKAIGGHIDLLSTGNTRRGNSLYIRYRVVSALLDSGE